MTELKDATPAETLDGWVTLTRYCEITGETRQAVHVRVTTGRWQRGVHYSKPDGGNAWINVPAVLLWVQSMAPPVVEVPVELPPPPVATAPDLGHVAEVEPAPATFKTWLAESMAEAGVYANSVGMDMPAANGSLGLLTKEAISAKQFPSQVTCAAWCEANTDGVFMPAEVELNYPA